MGSTPTKGTTIKCPRYIQKWKYSLQLRFREIDLVSSYKPSNKELQSMFKVENVKNLSLPRKSFIIVLVGICLIFVSTDSIAQTRSSKPEKVRLYLVGGTKVVTGDSSKSENIEGKTQWVKLVYQGNLDDSKTKPLGIRFYVYDNNLKIKTIIGAARLVTEKDTNNIEDINCKKINPKLKNSQFSCVVNFEPESNGVKPASGVKFYATTYNSAGESRVSNTINLFPVMDEKEFLDCLNNGIDSTFNSLKVTFTGFLIGVGSAQATSSLNSKLVLNQTSLEEGVVQNGISFTSNLINSGDLKETIKQSAESIGSGAAIEKIFRYLKQVPDLKIAGKVASKVNIAGFVYDGIRTGIEIQDIGKRGRLLISRC